MVKPFNDFVFNNPTGKTGVVETDFGYHVIKVGEKAEAVQIGTIAQLIQPSEETSDDLYAKSSKLEFKGSPTLTGFEYSLPLISETKTSKDP